MRSTKRKSKIARVHPFFDDVANKYKENFEKKFGFPIPKVQVSRQMAEVFDKMIEVNGMPVINKKNDKKKKRKIKTCHIFWEFQI